MTQSKMYKRHGFPPEIIQYAVWLYHRFSLSRRDVEDLMAQRGVTVSYEAIHLWCNWSLSRRLLSSCSAIVVSKQRS
jgi:transposase-like protein